MLVGALVGVVLVGAAVVLRRTAPNESNTQAWELLPRCSSVADYLEFGRKYFGFSVGLLVRIDDGEVCILERSGSAERAASLIVGARLLPQSLLCGRVAERREPVLLQNMGCSLWRGHPSQQFLGMDSYVGVPIVRDGKVRYVLSFLDWGYRETTFSVMEKKFLMQLARWIDLVIMENSEENQLITKNSDWEIQVT